VHRDYEWQDGNSPFPDLGILSLSHSLKYVAQDGDS
jgi:hypothetical protein